MREYRILEGEKSHVQRQLNQLRNKFWIETVGYYVIDNPNNNNPEKHFVLVQLDRK